MVRNLETKKHHHREARILTRTLSWTLSMFWVISSMTCNVFAFLSSEVAIIMVGYHKKKLMARRTYVYALVQVANSSSIVFTGKLRY